MIIYTARAAQKKEKEKRKKDGFVVVAQSKLLCLYFIFGLRWLLKNALARTGGGLDSNSLD